MDYSDAAAPTAWMWIGVGIGILGLLVLILYLSIRAVAADRVAKAQE